MPNLEPSLIKPHFSVRLCAPRETLEGISGGEWDDFGGLLAEARYHTSTGNQPERRLDAEARTPVMRPHCTMRIEGLCSMSACSTWVASRTGCAQLSRWGSCDHACCCDGPASFDHRARQLATQLSNLED